MTDQFALRVTDISKSYGRTRALDNLNMRVRPGEIRALLGANGAGKSTLIKCVAGIISPDVGILEVNGVPQTKFSVRNAVAAGIRVAHQELMVVGSMTVAENLTLGARLSSTTSSPRQRDRLYHELFDEWGILFTPSAVMRDLAPPIQATISLSKALVGDSRVLLLDEPTGALGPVEVEGLFRIIRRKAREGTAVVYVSHRLAEVARLCSDVTILRSGRDVYSGEISDVTEDELAEIITRDHAETAFTGGSVREHAVRTRPTLVAYPPAPSRSKSDRTILDLSHLVLHSGVKDASLSVREGEVLGLAGLVGSGRSELLEAIAGVRPLVSGEMKLNGALYRPRDPYAAVARGIIMVPEERAAQAIFATRDILFNMSTSRFRSLGRGPGGFFSAPRAYADRARELARDLGLKADALTDDIGSLSGGNQQKVILGRAMIDGLTVLLLDEPTRGVDVGARADFQRQIRELASRGVAIIYVASELSELSECDRIVVITEGRTITEAPTGVDFNEEKLTALCFPRSGLQAIAASSPFETE